MLKLWNILSKGFYIMSGQTNMGLDVLKIILLRGIREDCLDMLNLLGKGDVSKESFEKIIEL